MTNQPPSFTFVVGMHRSGTSALTQLLSTSDALNVGPVENLIGASKTNPHGHFEHERFTRFNDQLLKACGAHWAVPAQATPERLTLLARGEYGDQALALLSDLSADGVNLVKDPRLCLTLPFWRELLPANAAQVIAVFREPEAVAASIIRRNHVTERHALHLWSHYNLALLQAQQAELFRSITVNFADVMDEDPDVLKRLELVAGSSLPLDTASLDQRAVQTASGGEPPANCRQLWQILHARSTGQVDADLGELDRVTLPEVDWRDIAALFARKQDRANTERHAAALKANEQKRLWQDHQSEVNGFRIEAEELRKQLRTTEDALAAKRKRAANLALQLERHNESRPPANEAPPRDAVERLYRKARAQAAKSETARRAYQAVKRRRS